MDDGLSDRAARHAALGDPVRLRITDHLTWGDVSPGDLGAALGLTSNLLAHHLGVLQDAGLVTRHRSEADRRRSYVALARDEATCAVVGSTSSCTEPPWSGARRVLFVCTASSARSPLAAAIWNEAHPGLPAAAAGTRPGERLVAGAVREAARRGLRLTGAPAHLASVHQTGDVLVTVCDRAHEGLAPGSAPSVHWSVPDPVPDGRPAAFARAADDLRRRIAATVPTTATTSVLTAVPATVPAR